MKTLKARARLAGACLALLGLLSTRTSEAAVVLSKVTTVSAPVFVTHAGDQRLFVVEQGGRIRIFDRSTGILRSAPFLDIASKVLAGGERGLLSMAFHPDYASNGLFYVFYTAAGGGLTVERYKVTSDINVADSTSAARLLAIDHPLSNHNGGQLQIGPQDGHLYVGTGDGGGAGDPNCNAQRTNTLLGKMLRLDVRANLSQAPFYGIPSDNPFVGSKDPGNLVPDEVWATGLRNPWRFSFDRATGDLYVGDVGQNLYEEIDLRRAGALAGANFGWSVMEGLHCYAGTCPVGTPACNDPGFAFPVHEYDHSAGRCSVTGGYRYRGTRAPELVGRYVFADYCSGEVNTLREATPGNWQSTPLLQTGMNPTSFGQDVDGELYLVSGNDVWKLTSTTTAPTVPAAAPLKLLALAMGLASLGVAHAGWSRRSRVRRAPANG